MELSTYLVVGTVAVLVFLGGAALLRWYDRYVLGNPPSRWNWIWPGLFTLTIVVFALFRPGVGVIAVAGIVGVVSVAQYRAYRHRDLDPGDAPDDSAS